MPTDTQREPTETPLARAIREEREAERLEELWRGTPHRRIGTAKVKDARAATDEAVKAVEGALDAAIRLLTSRDALSDAEWRWCTDTVAAYVRGTTTTGGASDE